MTSYVHPDRGFDVLILADLLANYSEHGKLVQSVQRTLNRTSSARALVFFTHHQPWLVAKNMAFFELARSEGFGVSKLFEQVVEKVMFEADVGVGLLLLLGCQRLRTPGRAAATYRVWVRTQMVRSRRSKTFSLRYPIGSRMELWIWSGSSTMCNSHCLLFVAPHKALWM